MEILQQLLADDDNPDSLGNWFRAKRFAYFERLIKTLPRPLRIIDIGGTNVFWEQRKFTGRSDIQIITINHVAEPKKHDNIEPMVGDATDLRQFPTKCFHVAFSNSVIEHLSTFENQMAMAREIQRVGQACWVQTPNYWFPIEPHFRAPGWQWLPESLRVALLRRFSCGLRRKCPDLDKARRLVREIRLMTRRELVSLFPGARLKPEYFCGFVKSWIVISGFTECSF